jgi:DNA-binding NarL/FixJ family response regulator
MQVILLVDMPEGDGSVLASALRVEGFHVVMAASAAAARALLATETPAIALIDLMMRGEGATNGLELAREIKSTSPSTRVLLTSAYHLSERQLERADCGVSGFIPKPYDVAEVVEFIRQKVSGPPSSRRLWHAEPLVSEAASGTRRR